MDLSDEMAAPAKATGDHIAALHLIITDLAAIIHELAPEALEARLRKVRLEFQALEAGRLQHGSSPDHDARWTRLQLLERCVDESRRAS